MNDKELTTQRGTCDWQSDYHVEEHGCRNFTPADPKTVAASELAEAAAALNEAYIDWTQAYEAAEKAGVFA